MVHDLPLHAHNRSVRPVQDFLSRDPELTILRKRDPAYTPSSESEPPSKYMRSSSPPPMLPQDAFLPPSSPPMAINADNDSSTDEDEDDVPVRSSSLAAAVASRSLSQRRTRPATPDGVLRRVFDHDFDDTVRITGRIPVDLSDYGLQHVPDEVADLRSFFVVGQNREIAFNLNLAKNNIRSLTPVFDVPQIDILSLKDNKIEEIPPAIKSLRRLREITLVNNKLKALPIELLELPVEVLTDFPNPWLVPPPNAVAASCDTHAFAHEWKPLLGEDKPPTLSECCMRAMIGNQYLKRDLDRGRFKLGLTVTKKLNQMWSAESVGRACSNCGAGIVQVTIQYREWWYVCHKRDIPFAANFCSRWCANRFCQKSRVIRIN